MEFWTYCVRSIDIDGGGGHNLSVVGVAQCIKRMESEFPVSCLYID